MKIAYVFDHDFTALDLIGRYDVDSRWRAKPISRRREGRGEAQICASRVRPTTHCLSRNKEERAVSTRSPES